MQIKLLSWVVQSLSEAKRPSSITKLAIKHAILMALVSSGSTTSLRQKTQLPKIHPRNITIVVHHRESMWSTRNFLAIQKKRVDVLAPATKAIILAWWASKLAWIPIRKMLWRKDKYHICMKKTWLNTSWKLKFFLLLNAKEDE